MKQMKDLRHRVEMSIWRRALHIIFALCLIIQLLALLVGFLLVAVGIVPLISVIFCSGFLVVIDIAVVIFFLAE